MPPSKKDVGHLRILNACSPPLRKDLLKKFPKSIINCISECCLNTLKGNVPLNTKQKKTLSRHKHTLRLLADKKISVNKKRNVLIQKGGFLNILLPAALSVLTALIH